LHGFIIGPPFGFLLPSAPGPKRPGAQGRKKVLPFLFTVWPLAAPLVALASEPVAPDGGRHILHRSVSRPAGSTQYSGVAKGACLIDISISLNQYRVNTFRYFFIKKTTFFRGFWWFFYLVSLWVFYWFFVMVLFLINSDIEILSFSAACFIWLYSVSDALKLRPVLLSSGFTAGRPEPGRDPPFGLVIWSHPFLDISISVYL